MIWLVWYGYVDYYADKIDRQDRQDREEEEEEMEDGAYVRSDQIGYKGIFSPVALFPGFGDGTLQYIAGQAGIFMDQFLSMLLLLRARRLCL